jgi:hypothetical protein
MTIMITVPLDKLEDMQRRLKVTQAPVAWMSEEVLPLNHIIKAVVRREPDEQYTIPLYTHPVVLDNRTTQDMGGCLACVTCGQLVTKWQGLSDDEIQGLHKEHSLYIPTIKKIEAKLKEKNT